MTISNNFPSPSAPFLGPDGNISTVWWQYLLTLFNRTGAGQGIDAAALQALVAKLQGLITDLQTQANEGNPVLQPQGFINVTAAGVTRKIATY